MAISAYQIGIDLIANEAKVVGPLKAMFDLMEKVEGATKSAQNSLNEMVSSLRGAGRDANSLAVAMERVAKAAKDAARAGPIGGGSAGRTGAAAAAGATAQAERVAAASALANRPASASQALLTYESSSRALVPAQSRAVAPFVSSSTQGLLSGPAYTPYGGYSQGRPMRSQGGALVPFAGRGGSGGSGSGGFTLEGESFVPGSGPLVPFIEGEAIGGGSRQPMDLKYRAPMKLPSRKEIHKASVSAATEMAIPTYLVFEALKSVFDPTVNKDAALAGLMTQGFTLDQVQQAYKQAQTTQQKVRGSGVISNIEITSMLMANTQDAGAAIAATPDYARLGVALAATGHGDEMKDLQAAMGSAELRGIMFKKDASGKEVPNPEGLGLFLRENLAANAMSHGRIGPAQINQFLKSGGISAGTMTDQALFADSLPLMLAMGPARAGTALQGFGMQFSAGRMSEAGLNLLSEMGIIKNKKAVRKVGMGQFMLKPGAMADGDVENARNTPAAFIMDRLLPQIDSWLTKNYGERFTKGDDKTRVQYEAAAFQQIASRIPGGNEMAETMRNNPLIFRDREAFKKTMGRNIEGIQDANNPKITEKALSSAFEAFKISLGDAAMKPAIDMLNGFTGALNKMADWAKANPDGAKAALEGLAIGVAALGVGTAAAAAMALMTGPGGFVALAVGIEALGGSIKAIPKFVLDAASGAVIGGGAGLAVGGPVGAAIGAGAGAVGGVMVGGIVRGSSKPAADYNADEGLFHRESYARPANSNTPPIHNIMYLDGEVVHRSVINRDARAARSSAQQGMTGFDSSETPLLSGGTLAI
jgi:hypothetical protein